MSGVRTRAYEKYEKGRNLCENGGVISIYLVNDVLHAVVRGRSAEYKIKFREDELYKKSCRCSEVSSWEMCSHEVAALTYFFQHEREVVDAEMARQDAICHFFRTIPKEQLGFFTTSELKNDISAYRRFVKQLGLENVWVPRNYSRVITYLYDTKTRWSPKGIVDFGFYFDLVRRARDAGKHSEVTAAYRIMSEAIISSVQYTANTNNYEDAYLTEALDRMADSILREDCASKEQYIGYFYQRCNNTVWSRYLCIYRECLESICETENDLKYWESLVKRDLSKYADKAVQAHLLLMHSYILQRLGDVQGAVESLSSRFLSDNDVALRYLSLLSSVPHTPDPIHAILEAFPRDRDILKSGLKLLKISDSQRPAILFNLFVMTGDWELFGEMKSLSKDWSATLHRLSRTLHPSHLSVEVYVKEKMSAEATEILKSMDDPAMYKKFAARLSRGCQEAYFEMYGSCIKRFARSKTGVEHYHLVVEHLKRIRSIHPDGFDSLLASIKSANRGRRALIRLLVNI